MDYHVAPKLKFPLDWEIDLDRPFGGAYVRFTKKGEQSSIDEAVGPYYGAPYWEVYRMFKKEFE